MRCNVKHFFGILRRENFRFSLRNVCLFKSLLVHRNRGKINERRLLLLPKFLLSLTQRHFKRKFERIVQNSRSKLNFSKALSLIKTSLIYQTFTIF